MDFLINYETLHIIIAAIASGLFTGTSVAIYKIILGFFQKDRFKSFSFKQDKNLLVEISFTGYSIAELKELADVLPIKPIIKEIEKPKRQLLTNRKSK